MSPVCHRRHLFGLCLASNEPLAGGGDIGVEDHPPPDLRIFFGPSTALPQKVVSLAWQPYVPGQTGESGYRISFADGEDGRWFRLDFIATTLPHRMTFLINHAGDQIWAGWDYPPATEDEALHAAISLFHSRVLSVVLSLRGLLCLHGAVLSRGDSALALLGDMGAGKSTLAAALLDSHCRLLADDKVVVNSCGEGWSVEPGGDLLRLWPDTLQHLTYDPDRLLRVLRRNDKRFLPVPGRNVDKALPLRAIYLLGTRSNEYTATWLEPLSPAAALFHLLDQRLGASIHTQKQLAEDVHRLKLIAEGIPVRLVHRPDQLSSLPETVSAILEDFQGHTP